METFGTSARTIGIIKHIESELKEVEADPFDLKEWIDIIILGLDGYWRHGGTSERLMELLVKQQDRNMKRKYKKTPDNEPSFHLQQEAGK